MALNNAADAAATDPTWRKSYVRKGPFHDPPTTIHLWRSPDGNGSRCGQLRDRAPRNYAELCASTKKEPQHATWSRPVANCAACLTGPEAPAASCAPPAQLALDGAAAVLAALDGRRVA